MTASGPTLNSGARAARGGVTIEFGVSFAVLFAVFAGVFQFGYAFYQYNQLVSAVRGGARYASLRTYNSSSSTPSADFLSAVRNMVVYGDPNGGSLRLVRGLTPEQVSLTVTMDRNVPAQVTVGVTNYQIQAVVTSMTLNGKPKVAFPYTGRYAP
jgi:Flp pilus assembly protein TadG